MEPVGNLRELLIIERAESGTAARSSMLAMTSTLTSRPLLIEPVTTLSQHLNP
jgi:hypothetical protein